MSLIACSGLVLGYEGRIVASDLSFEAKTGDYICIVGENGSGKTIDENHRGTSCPFG